jgi:hypothetical protein
MLSLGYSNRIIGVDKSHWDVGCTHVGELRFLAVVSLGSEAWRIGSLFPLKDCVVYILFARISFTQSQI